MATEDIPYNVSAFATPEEEHKTTDPDQVNKSALIEVQKYLAEAIEEHKTVDIIDLTDSAKMDPREQIAVHKLVVNHLRSVKEIIDSKVKELK